MATLFTKIIDGEIPGRFVWRDDTAVAIMTIAPLKPGHTLVIPRQELDHWLDAPPALMAHLMEVSRHVGAAIQRAFAPAKVGVLVAGLEVPHLHIHLVPIDKVTDLDFAQQNSDATPADLDDAAQRIRSALGEMGRAEAVEG